MKRAVYDKQFKVGAVKLAVTSASSVSELAGAMEQYRQSASLGSMNTTNMVKARFLGTGTRFLTAHMK